MAEILVFLIIGCLGGFLSGLLGIGGGVVLIPLLVYFGGMDINSAAVTSMIFIVVASVSAIIGHFRLGNIIPRVGIAMGLAGVLGSFFAAYFSGAIAEHILQIIFMAVIMLAIVMLLFREREHRHGEETAVKMAPVVLVGLLKGALTGLLGVGGGFIVVPLMIYLLGLPIHYAVGTSLVVNLLSALAGIGGKAAGISLFLGPAWWVVVGAIPCAQLGCFTAARIKPSFLRYILLFILLAILTAMVYELVFLRG